MAMARGAALAMLAMLVMLGGCSSLQIRDHQGYMVDNTLVSSVQPGVDNRDSVLATLGRPSFQGQFDQRDWYYVSRDTRQLAFNSPKPVAQTVLHVRFDEAGNVASVERTGLERVASIDPMSDETPTLGRDRGFFQEIFGNIGSVGRANPTGASDPTNPQ